MRRALKDPETPVILSAKLREYGIQVNDGGTSYLQIFHCPWSGHELPKSLRREWLANIRRLGLEPGDKRIPEEYSDERWYLKGPRGRRRTSK